MNIASLIRSFKTATNYTVTRRAAAANDGHGRLLPGATSTLPIVASVQPASGLDLQRLPEGRRTTETKTVYTITPLLEGGQGSANDADLITIDGAQWEVQNVRKWTEGGPGNTGYIALVQRLA